MLQASWKVNFKMAHVSDLQFVIKFYFISIQQNIY